MDNFQLINGPEGFHSVLERKLNTLAEEWNVLPGGDERIKNIRNSAEFLILGRAKMVLLRIKRGDPYEDHRAYFEGLMSPDIKPHLISSRIQNGTEEYEQAAQILKDLAYYVGHTVTERHNQKKETPQVPLQVPLWVQNRLAPTEHIDDRTGSMGDVGDIEVSELPFTVWEKNMVDTSPFPVNLGTEESDEIETREEGLIDPLLPETKIKPVSKVAEAPIDVAAARERMNNLIKEGKIPTLQKLSNDSLKPRRLELIKEIEELRLNGTPIELQMKEAQLKIINEGIANIFQKSLAELSGQASEKSTPPQPQASSITTAAKAAKTPATPLGRSLSDATTVNVSAPTQYVKQQESFFKKHWNNAVSKAVAAVAGLAFAFATSLAKAPNAPEVPTGTQGPIISQPSQQPAVTPAEAPKIETAVAERIPAVTSQHKTPQNAANVAVHRAAAAFTPATNVDTPIVVEAFDLATSRMGLASLKKACEMAGVAGEDTVCGSINSLEMK